MPHEHNADSASVIGVFRALAFDPWGLLIQRWNWKAAIFSSLFRGSIFFTVNLAAGWRAALGALLAEFLLRAATSGFYGALTQAFRRVEPAHTAALTVVILLPVATHSLEFLVHWARGTPKLALSIAVSACFTCVSTLFNLYAMRRGTLVTGHGGASLADDMRRMPGVVAGFLLAGPKLIRRRLIA